MRNPLSYEAAMAVSQGLLVVVGWFVGVLVLAAAMYMAVQYAFRPGSVQGVGKRPDPKNFTSAQLSVMDGEDGRPLYLAVLGKVYDVSRGKAYYGKGAGYQNLCARDATIMLAKMETDPTKVDHMQPLDTLTQEQRASVDGWASFFDGKYPLVGYLVDGVLPLSVEAEKAKSAKLDEARYEHATRAGEAASAVDTASTTDPTSSKEE
jgi:membrane-associated progesterone receptor component